MNEVKAAVMKKRMFRWSLVSTITIALFWSIFYLIKGYVPVVTFLDFFEMSRWWDILIGPLWSISLVYISTKMDVSSGSFVLGLAYCLIISLILLGLIFHFAYGPTYGPTYGLMLSLIFCLIFGISYGLAYGLMLGLAYCLAYGLIFGFSYGLISGLTLGLCYILIYVFLKIVKHILKNFVRWLKADED